MSEKVEQAINETIRSALELAATPPQQRKEKSVPPRWTLKRLVCWVKQTFDIDCCRATLLKVMKKLGFSWKKRCSVVLGVSPMSDCIKTARKLLNKANPEKRASFLETLKELLDEALHDQCLLVYVDEAHIHLDSDQGYGWSIKGERFWVSSSSPGLEKVSFYGVYLYNLAQVRLFGYDCANKDNTKDMMKKLRAEFPNVPIKLVWDGAPYHRANLVKEEAESLGISLEPLPSYSPDFMPVEHLWQWLREDVTYHRCYEKKADLITQVESFQEQINSTPLNIADRLWVTTHLKPEEEKLRFST